MDTTYYLLLLTFLAYPIVGLILSRFITLDKISNLIKPTILLFLIYNVFFAIGYSLKGDYADYIIFSIEYLAFCFATCLSFKIKNTYVKAFRVVGTIVISFGFIIGLIGIFMFIPISQDFESDKIFHFISNDKTYETRRYSFGFATLSDTRYTFKTFRVYKYLPFEKKIDKTNFFDTKTDLLIYEDALKISIIDSGDRKQIRFISTNGRTFSKFLN
jgi:hypothetical protein